MVRVLVLVLLVALVKGKLTTGAGGVVGQYATKPLVLAQAESENAAVAHRYTQHR